ncbi:MAG: UDP-N-acetylmuramoyl-L-alanyl-D-glutamate--2,6-diaminopimelate ligase [Oscillospiraceae bacterium]|nr:UDP-N-acetylmuramoyl-L-alanyl-D-glutamate--2,6-diaminopimelate ligase [Oscillospiraceae bacterium]
MRVSKLLESLSSFEPCGIESDPEAAFIRNDSRIVRAGDVFVAVRGAKLDGHDYVNQALSRGAILIVSEEKLTCAIPHIVVPDAREALARLAACFFGYPAKKLRMIGVTGTNGKTSVAYMIHGILEHVGHKSGIIGTIVSERTTPDAITLHQTLRDMVDQGCEYCVMEVSSHALVQNRVDGIRYHTAVFTNLQQDHLDYHSSMEDYFVAKRKLFFQTDWAVINTGDEWGRRILGTTNAGRVIRYAVRNEIAELTAGDINCLPDAVEFTAIYSGRNAPVRWATPGLFSVQNALAAIGICLACELTLEQIAQAMGELKPVKGRMERVPVPADFTVLIDYAHTPDALKNVLLTAKQACKGRLIALFGCGGDRDRAKRPLMGQAVSSLPDIAIVTSDNPRTEPPMQIIEDILKGMTGEPIVYPDRKEAIFEALRIAQTDDVLILCGKGHEDYTEINGQKLHFDEREIVAEYFGIKS